MSKNNPPEKTQQQEIRAITKSELAISLGYSRRTLYRKMSEVNLPIIKGLLTPEKQNIIRVAIGWPPLKVC